MSVIPLQDEQIDRDANKPNLLRVGYESYYRLQIVATVATAYQRRDRRYMHTNVLRKMFLELDFYFCSRGSHDQMRTPLTCSSL